MEGMRMEEKYVEGGAHGKVTTSGGSVEWWRESAHAARGKGAVRAWGVVGRRKGRAQADVAGWLRSQHK